MSRDKQTDNGVTLSQLCCTAEYDGTLLEASRLDSIKSIREKLKPYYDQLVALYENEMLVSEEDYRTGNDTYGYADLESIQGSLYYISDRWKVTFRIRWLIELINPDYCLWDGSTNSP